LSGGLDSTSVTAVAVTEPRHPAAYPGQLRSYSYIFRELTTCDESSYIASVVERYGLQQTNVIGDDCWPLRDLAEWPIPADPVSFDAYWWLIIKLMQAAQADDVRVMLTGHFGDWLFGGSVYWAADMLRDLKVRELWSILRASDFKNKRQYLINNGLRQFIPPAMRSRYRMLRPRDQLARHPSIHPNLATKTDLPNRLTGRQPDPGFNAPGMWNRYRDLTFGIVPPTMADLATMWNRHGIELLEPMRDLKLIEFVYSIPADQLGLPEPGKSKRVLRAAMEGLLPDAVRRRRTITSFEALYLLGLMDKERHTVECILDQPQIVSREFVDPDWLADTLPGGCTFTDEGFSLWRCVTLELWLNRHQPK
jgi:asparagine synthase (glutamine-hydrolysing)